MTIEARREALLNAMGRMADGDRDALHEVYEMTSAKLMAVVLAIVHEPEQSKDIVQEVYLKAWNRAGRYDPAKGSPITWLCAIARNAAIDWARKFGRAVEIGVETLPEIRDDAPDAEELLCSAQDRERLNRCLETLQDDQRRSIRLAYFRGLTHSQLAEQIGVPLGTMKSWIRRGLASLRGCLADG